MRSDLRFAARMLAKNPGFTAMAAIALALGIGANTAIFSVVNAVLLGRMPFQDPSRLVMVWDTSPRTGTRNVVNPLNFIQWRERNRSFERISALVEFDASITGGGEPEVIGNMAVSDGFFQILGVQPLLGRWFTAQEDTPGNDGVVMIGESLWRRRYAADPGVIGRQIRLNNRNMTIVGVMPAAFRFPLTRAELWQPLGIDPVKARKTGRYLMTVARLRDGANLISAKADMNVLAHQLQKERPDFNSKWGITVIAFRDYVTGDVRLPLLVLLGAVALVLLIACANVANLLLMRAAARSREIAVRAALGAGAGRIVRQLLVESALLAAAGGALGLAIGLWTMNALAAALPATIAYANLKTVRIDSTVFLFTAAISLLTGILFGLAPALKSARADVQTGLREGGRGSTARGSLRNALVAAEVALSLVLLIGAGLLIRSFARLAAVDPGFDARHVISMQLAEAARFDNDSKNIAFNQQVLDRVRAIPGIEAAGMSHFLPLGRIIPATGFWRADRPRPAHGEESVTQVLVVMPGYFAAMGIPTVRGRVFDDRDRAGAPHVIVINQTLARQVYPNEDPIGKVLAVQWGDDPYQIAGVVGDVRQSAIAAPPKPAVFIPNLQEPTGPNYLVARAHGDPLKLASAIQREIHGLARDLPISDVKTMDESVSASVAAPRFNTILLGGFAGLALLLAAVGIFGVVSYSVAQRTQEIGIRRALGANSANVLRLVLRQGLTFAGIGVAIGLAAAFAVTRLLRSLLYGVAPTDAATFIAVPLVLIAVAVAASLLPARRAAKVDPMEALRYE